MKKSNENNKISNVKYLVASNVGGRDGIGLEVYVNDEMVIEICRDDESKLRTVSVYKNEIPLELLEQAVQEFKRKISWEYLD